MKGILVVLDGLGDLPNKKLGEKTPLEAAETPNLDFLANRGEIGYMYTVKPGFIPGSDEAITSMFGNELISSTRGQLEAAGTDLKLTRGDLALRANFATIDSLKKKNVIDRRAGRTLTTSEAEVFAKALNKIKLPCEFIFKPTIQHRGVLVFKGGFSDNISNNDISYNLRDKPNVAFDIYKKNLIKERFRHRYEVNPKYIKILEDHGIIFTGVSKENKEIMQILEIPRQKFFLATQFHPEFTSRPLNPNPIFIRFAQNCLD